MSQYTIGIDLGGTPMTAGLVDETYHIVAKLTWATRLPCLLYTSCPPAGLTANFLSQYRP